MAQYFAIHPDDPQPRLVRRAVEIVRAGGVIVYPTDTCYALGCAIGNKAGAERICKIRQVDDRHNFTLVCRDFADASQYAKVDNPTFRFIKGLTPGPYTFIVQATRELPRRLQNPRRRTVGIRIPGFAVVDAMIAELGEPLMSSTLILPDDDLPLSDPVDIRMRLEHSVDAVIDGGTGGLTPTTVIDLTEDAPRVRRIGAGDVSMVGR
jgi:tRNA threonylcarbamoyl adenosine modification protein (Sua5/YciO/YrdC/YwlC family)